MPTAEQIRESWNARLRERRRFFTNLAWQMDKIDPFAGDKILDVDKSDASPEVKFILGTTTIGEDPTQLAYNRPDAPERRVKISWVKWLKKLGHLGYEILPECKYQALMTLVEIHLLPPKSPKFIPNVGDAINDVYKRGPGSCMKNLPSLTAWYQENPKTVPGILAIQHNDIFSARALVFKTIDGDMVLGRVYTSAPKELDAMLEYAREKGWDVPTIPTSYDSKYNSGKVHIIKMKYSSSGKYPYVDIFGKGVDVGDGYELWSCSDALFTALKIGDRAVEFSSTDGSIVKIVRGKSIWQTEGEGIIEVTAGTHAGEHHYEDDVILIGNDYYHRDDLVWSNNNTPIPRDRAVWVDSIGDYARDDDVVEDWQGNIILRNEACVIAWGRYAGKYALPCHVVRDVYGEDILKSEAVYIGSRCYHQDDVVKNWKGEYIPLEDAVKLTFGPIVGEFAHRDECVQVDSDWCLRPGRLC